jgi:hypothetical protein
VESLLGKPPTLIPAKRCGPSDIRSVLVQTFVGLYDIDLDEVLLVSKFDFHASGLITFDFTSSGKPQISFSTRW